jgi:hypothetical protein
VPRAAPLTLAVLVLSALGAGCGGGRAEPLETAASPTTAPALTVPASTAGTAASSASTGAAGSVPASTGAEALPGTPAGACGPVHTFPSAGRAPVRRPPPPSVYTSDPPTSGPHDTALAPWGPSEREIPAFTVVANLEAGGIAVLYGDRVSPGWIGSAVGWAAQDPGGILIAPSPSLGETIAVVAWRHLMRCTQFDERAFSAFRDAYRYKGPVDLSPEAYRP